MSTLDSDTKKPFRITIIGGGICGLSAAIALRGPNRTITILEQSRFLREVGAAISLQPNATKILSTRWGVDSSSSCPRIVDQGFRVYSTDGDLVREIPAAGMKERYGADRVVYHRRDLHALLLHAATTAARPHAPARIRLGVRVTGVDAETGDVAVADGGVVGGDLVVAADGIRSVVRGGVVGGEVGAVPTGLSAYRFMVPVAKLRGTAFAGKIDPGAEFTSMVMGWDRRVVMGPCRTVVGEADSGEYAVVALVPDGEMGQDVEGSTWNTEGSVEGLREAFKGFPVWVKCLLELADEVGLWQLRDLEPLKRWHRGRVVLVGDAAHAMLPTQGQGASQSLEDAEALGAMFEDVDGWIGKEEVESRLEEMVSCRYGRATLIQTYSRQAAKPATNGKDSKVTLTTAEFMDYNCTYDGARDYQLKIMKKSQGEAYSKKETRTGG